MALSPAALAMMAQGKANPRALLSQMVSEMADDDPQMALVGQYLAMQPEDDEADATDDFDETTTSRDWIDDSELMSLRDEIGSIQITLDTQAELLEELSERNLELAAALGACPQCWGEDKECSVCRGGGVPGALKPDKSCFDYYVSPLVSRLKSTAARRAQPPPPRSPF